MHGQIHIILKDLIINAFSIETRAAILRRSSLQEDHLLEAVQQPDEVTFKLLVATCEETELSLEDALEAFGRHLVTFTMQSGYAGLLKSLGPTFPVFLTNVNYLHNHLERQHPHALFPYIETNHEHGQDSLEMHYLSTRPRMKQIVVGIVVELGLQLFGLDVSMTEQSSPRYAQRNAAGSERAASWEISWRPTSQKSAIPRHPRPTAPKASFPDIHAAMVDFGKLLSSFDVFSTFSCCVTEDDHEFTPLDCSASELTEAERKFEAVRSAATSRLEEVLLRATPAHLLAAGWSDASMKSCIDFWSSSVGTALNYAMSHDADAVDIFVSHAWLPPADWEEMMGPDVNYGEMKAATLAVMAKDFAQEHGSFQDWHQITFWVDKACIAQEHPELKKLSINLLDNFIQRCDSMCVLFCWTYLQRLWCVYEWACVLIHKPTEKAYISKQQFEVLVKATVIALMARSMAFRAGRSPKLYFTYFQPWVALAFELGMDELGAALDSCDCLTWRRVATISSGENTGKKVQPAEDRATSATEADKSEAAPSDSTSAPQEASEASQETAESSTKEVTPEKPKSPEKVPAPEPKVESAPPKEAEAASAASAASAPSEKTSRQEISVLRPSFVYTSGFQRALETCYPIAESLNLPPRFHQDLHEEGGVFEGPRRGIRRESYPLHFGMNSNQMCQVLPGLQGTENIPEQGWWVGGQEPPNDAQRRANRCAEWLWKMAEEQGCDEAFPEESSGAVVCVTHGLFMDRLIKALAGLDPHLGSMLIMTSNCAYWLVQLRIDHDENTPRIAVMAACNVVDHVPMSIRTGHSICGIAHCQPSYT
eukprot:s182_g37.t1